MAQTIVMVFTDDRETLLSPSESPVLRQHDKPMALSNDAVAEIRVTMKLAPELCS